MKYFACVVILAMVCALAAGHGGWSYGSYPVAYASPVYTQSVPYYGGYSGGYLGGYSGGYHGGAIYGGYSRYGSPGWTGGYRGVYGHGGW